MNFQELIRKRRSVRKFREEDVSEEKLEKVLDAARMAPSAHNAQDYKILVVRDEGKKKDLMKAAFNQTFIAEASVIIVFVSLDPEHQMSCQVPAYAVDVAISADHLVLAAAEEDLGTCWIGAFEQKEVKRILNIPEEYKAVIMLPLGAPYDRPAPKSRKSLKELVCYDKFSK